jgi:hypothetical protein
MAMKKRALVAITAGVWLAAIGSAAALTYDLNRPLHADKPLRDNHAVTDTAAPSTEAPRPPTKEATPTVQMMPTFTVVGYVHAPRASHPAPKPLPDIAKMHCGQPRQLEMGSGHVQECD